MRESKEETRLPEWQLCLERVEAGAATALEQFIFDNEPAGDADAAFRAGLQALLAEARAVFEAEIAPPICKAFKYPLGHLPAEQPPDWIAVDTSLKVVLR